MNEYILSQYQGALVIANNNTKEITKVVQGMCVNNKKLYGWQCVILQLNNNLRKYALFNEKGVLINMFPINEISIDKINEVVNNYYEKELTKCLIMI